MAGCDHPDCPNRKLEGETCKRCGGRNAVWAASSPLWNAVMRGGSIDGEPKFNDMVCASCFMHLAEEQGVASRFHVTADQVNVELETVTPSGRVWDEKARFWVGPSDDQPSVEVDEEVDDRRWKLTGSKMIDTGPMAQMRGEPKAELVTVVHSGPPVPNRTTIEVMPVAAAPAIAAKAVEEWKERYGYREGEDPLELQEAQAGLEGLLGGIDLHAPDCGIPHPADPDQGDRGCTCGVDRAKQRFADVVAESLDVVRAQAVEEKDAEIERLRERYAAEHSNFLTCKEERTEARRERDQAIQKERELRDALGTVHKLYETACREEDPLDPESEYDENDPYGHAAVLSCFRRADSVVLAALQEDDRG